MHNTIRLWNTSDTAELAESRTTNCCEDSTIGFRPAKLSSSIETFNRVWTSYRHNYQRTINTVEKWFSWGSKHSLLSLWKDAGNTTLTNSIGLKMLSAIPRLIRERLFVDSHPIRLTTWIGTCGFFAFHVLCEFTSCNCCGLLVEPNYSFFWPCIRISAHNIDGIEANVGSVCV